MTDSTVDAVCREIAERLTGELGDHLSLAQEFRVVEARIREAYDAGAREQREKDAEIVEKFKLRSDQNFQEQLATAIRRGGTVMDTKQDEERQAALDEAKKHSANFHGVPWDDGFNCGWQARAAQEPRPASGKTAFNRRRFEQPPCFICGYNGDGYYQPDKHPCARMYHASQEPSVPRETVAQTAERLGVELAQARERVNWEGKQIKPAQPSGTDWHKLADERSAEIVRQVTEIEHLRQRVAELERERDEQKELVETYERTMEALAGSFEKEEKRLHERADRLEKALREGHRKLQEAVKVSGNRWDEWSDRAVSVAERIDEAMILMWAALTSGKEKS